jgi:Mg-chelatase subunit ChlD
VSRARLAVFTLAFALAVLAAVGTPSGGGREVVYVLDVSRSHGPAADLLRDRLRGWHERGPFADRTPRVILAGAGAVEAGGEPPPGFAEGSRLDLGLELARRTLGRADRVVVVSDGRFDHAAAAAQARALADAGATVSFAGPLAEPALDLRLVPRGFARVEGGQARVRVAVTGTNREPREVALSVLGGSEPARAKLVLPPGGVEEWEALVPVMPSVRRLTVAIEGAGDAAPANDQLPVLVQRDERRAIAVGAQSGLQRPVIVEALKESGWSCDLVDDLASLDLRELALADVLILVDQAVTEADQDRVRGIESAVTEGGLGLWVVGGEHAFRAGNYAASRLDDLLPLSSRPEGGRAITVLLDTSGSMEKDGRLLRAVDAVAELAAGLAPSDRLAVIPFAQAPAAPIPPEPASPADFLAAALPALRRLAPHGGTRLLPALDAVLAGTGPEGLKRVVVMVTDARDDQVSLDDLAARREALLRKKIDSIVVWLDPAPESMPRAHAMATARVVEAGAIAPRVLLEVFEDRVFTPGPLESVRPGGASGPAIAWWNTVRAGAGAQVALTTKDERPLMATAFRGVGQTAAWAAWPVEKQVAAKLAGGWVKVVARPADWKRLSVRRDGARLLVSMPPASAPPRPLRVLSSGRTGDPAPLHELTPGVFEVPAAACPGDSLAIFEGDAVFALAPIPPAGDPEYAFPPGLPPGAGLQPSPAFAGRLRAPWAALAALAWAAGMLLRRRAA